MILKSMLLRGGSPSLFPAALLSCILALAGRSPAAAAERESRLPILFVCGDSTANSDAPIQGWGDPIAGFFDPAKIRVENHARGGRSSRTFIEEGRWEGVRSHLQPGDFVLIQFGHNDTKSVISANRYTLPGLGDEVEQATDPKTGAKHEIRTFGYYMRKMITEAKATGAHVIVLSPVPRCKWAGGRVVRGEENHGPWARELAAANGVDFVDVNDIISLVWEPIGQARIKALYFPKDNTHTNPAGARVNAACVVRGLLATKDLPIEAYLRKDALQSIDEVIASVAKDAETVKIPAPAEKAPAKT